VRAEDVLEFLRAVDAALVPFAGAGEALDLHLIGRSALVLRYGVDLATRDVDIVHFDLSALERKAVELFGKGTPGAERAGFYLEPVPQGLPRLQPLCVA
jgi:hypothetical protein